MNTYRNKIRAVLADGDSTAFEVAACLNLQIRQVQNVIGQLRNAGEIEVIAQVYQPDSALKVNLFHMTRYGRLVVKRVGLEPWQDPDEELRRQTRKAGPAAQHTSRKNRRREYLIETGRRDQARREGLI